MGLRDEIAPKLLKLEQFWACVEAELKISEIYESQIVKHLVSL